MSIPFFCFQSQSSLNTGLVYCVPYLPTYLYLLAILCQVVMAKNGAAWATLNLAENGNYNFLLITCSNGQNISSAIGIFDHNPKPIYYNSNKNASSKGLDAANQNKKGWGGKKRKDLLKEMKEEWMGGNIERRRVGSNARKNKRQYNQEQCRASQSKTYNMTLQDINTVKRG